ncbi:MAG: anaerobic sulfite reductase subunit AsrA [Anaerovoracaceae bacterium]|jgi:anaerobic sulfite reductase subunit A
MGYYVSQERMDQIINELKNEYKIYAPKRLKNRGWDAGTDMIRYGEISSVSEIVTDEKSHFSPKEIFYPVMQTTLYFKDNKCIESDVKDDKDILIFAHPCDINGIKRLDTIFLKNGDQEDNYYKRLREKVKFIMMECKEGFDNCFCVSMDSNKTDDYSLAVRFDEEGLLIELKDSKFDGYFSELKQADFTPEFPEKNQITVKLPNIPDKDVMRKVYGLDVWQKYNTDCIGCGGCNTVCITCSCFDTTDIIYDETSMDGERRRVWASCMLEQFSTMAGGHNVRKTQAERMRFRTLHKVYDYKNRFNDGHMCVGCGRCDNRCPKDLSFSDTINKMTDELEGLMAAEGTKEVADNE